MQNEADPKYCHLTSLKYRTSETLKSFLKKILFLLNIEAYFNIFWIFLLALLPNVLNFMDKPRGIEINIGFP